MDPLLAQSSESQSGRGASGQASSANEYIQVESALGLAGGYPGRVEYLVGRDFV